MPDSLVEQHLGIGVGDSVLCLQSTGALDQDVLEVLFHLGGDGHQGLGIGRYRFGSFAALEANQIERDVLVLDAYLQQVGKDLDGVGPLPDDVGFGVAAQASAHPHLIVDVVPGRTYFVIGELCLQYYLPVAMIQCVHFRCFYGAKIGLFLLKSKNLCLFIALDEINLYLCRRFESHPI